MFDVNVLRVVPASTSVHIAAEPVEEAPDIGVTQIDLASLHGLLELTRGNELGSISVFRRQTAVHLSIVNLVVLTATVHQTADLPNQVSVVGITHKNIEFDEIKSGTVNIFVSTTIQTYQLE